ncbi:MAG: hypothetical protein JWQ36_684, partial [Enterovirga sp.]|nr:hypothetical protein [Enterovirga sp.]
MSKPFDPFGRGDRTIIMPNPGGRRAEPQPAPPPAAPFPPPPPAAPRHAAPVAPSSQPAFAPASYGAVP